jgi:hypothetical protein
VRSYRAPSTQSPRPVGHVKVRRRCSQVQQPHEHRTHVGSAICLCGGSRSQLYSGYTLHGVWRGSRPPSSHEAHLGWVITLVAPDSLTSVGEPGQIFLAFTSPQKKKRKSWQLALQTPSTKLLRTSLVCCSASFCLQPLSTTYLTSASWDNSLLIFPIRLARGMPSV